MLSCIIVKTKGSHSGLNNKLNFFFFFFLDFQVKIWAVKFIIPNFLLILKIIATDIIIHAKIHLADI